MKKCAKCGRDYDDAYDGCPKCAESGGTADRLQSCGCIFLILLAIPFLWLILNAVMN